MDWTKDSPTQPGPYWVHCKWTMKKYNLSGEGSVVEYVLTDEKGAYVMHEMSGTLCEAVPTYLKDDDEHRYWFMGPLEEPPPPKLETDNKEADE